MARSSGWRRSLPAAGVSRETLRVGCRQPAWYEHRIATKPGTRLSAPLLAPPGCCVPRHRGQLGRGCWLRPWVPLISSPLLPLPLPGAGQTGGTGLEVIVAWFVPHVAAFHFLSFIGSFCEGKVQVISPLPFQGKS